METQVSSTNAAKVHAPPVRVRRWEGGQIGRWEAAWGGNGPALALWQLSTTSRQVAGVAAVNGNVGWCVIGWQSWQCQPSNVEQPNQTQVWYVGICNASQLGITGIPQNAIIQTGYVSAAVG